MISIKKNLFCAVLCVCTSVGTAQTFFNVDGVRYLLEDEHVIVARQDVELTGNIEIPSTITVESGTYAVTRIISPSDRYSGGGGAFQECAITGITLPESITEVPDNAFNGCKQLSSVSLCGAVTRIGSSAFFECESLTSINLPDDVTEMADLAFYCSGLTEFRIPSGVTQLSDFVLAGTKIAYLEIPSNVIRISGGAFDSDLKDEQGNKLKKTVKMSQRDCRLLDYEVNSFGDMTTIDLQVPAGGKVVYQEYFPWMNMNSITEYGEDTGETLVPDQRHITFGGILYMLKNGEAFVGIQPETLSGEIIIPEQVTYEGVSYPVTTIMGSYFSAPQNYDALYAGSFHYSGAFTQTQVTKVTLPNSIKTIGDNAFSMAQKLQEVVLNEGITEIGVRAFCRCPELTTVNIPSAVGILRNGALSDCPKLISLTLKEGIECLDWYALSGTGIETLTIPSTCKLLGYASLNIPNMKTLYVNIKEPTDIKAMDYNDRPATMNSTVFGYDTKNVDLIVPLGCAESYMTQAPWFNCRSVTDVGSPYLKLNGSVFSAPEGAFTVTNTENDGEPEFEKHDGWFGDTYTHGLCLKEGTTVSFNTTGTSWIYVYLYSSNSNTIRLDGVEITNAEIGDDQSGTYSFRRYDRLVVGAGEHTITCNTYEGNQWPCMFLLQVQNVSGDYYQPKNIGVNIGGINFVLKETVNELDETIRTATIGRQNTSLRGDITIPAKVSYAKSVLQGNEWVTMDAYDYDVTDMVVPGFEVDEMPGIHRTTDGAFQECQITSISLPATITTIPAGTFNGCQQLKNVNLAEGVTTIGAGAFANCTSLEDIYLPETITDMNGWYIFGNCRSLKKVNIPKQVTSLGYGCFMRSGIETFLIPKSITSIGGACFDATNLKDIKICHESYSDGSIWFPEEIFSGINLNEITLIVPQGTKESLYSQVYPWKNFGSIIEYTDQNDEHQYNAYRVSYTEEIVGDNSTAARRQVQAGEETTTLGFAPSGISTTLIDEPVKEGYVLTEWMNSDGTDTPEDMPAIDIVLKAVFTLLGNVNGENGLDIGDAVCILNFLVDEDTPTFIKKAADINKSGKIDIGDAVSILNLLVGDTSEGLSRKAATSSNVKVPQ